MMLSVLQTYVLIKRLGCVMRGKRHSGADVVGGFWIDWDNVETDHQTDDRADTISWEEFQKFD